MNKKLLAFTLINLYLFISTIIVTYITLSFGTVAGQVDTGTNVGWFYIATFTVESNIFLGVIAAASAIFGLRSLIQKVPLPKNIVSWYLVASSAAMLTCLTVVFFLAPIRASSGKNYFEMLMGPMFFFHFFNPVLSAITLVFLTDSTKLTRNSRLLALLPPVLYSVPYILNVAVLKSWPDFYGITFNGKYFLIPVVFVAFCLIVYGIASLLSFCHNRAIINTRRKGGRAV